MRVKVLFFGMLKDVAGRPAEELDIPGGATLGSVFDEFAGRHPRLRELAGSIVLARNREFAGRAEELRDGDEVAFLPPVSGGSGGHYFALTRAPIDTRQIISRIITGAEGAVVTFEGTVRNHTAGRRTLYLDYEGYEPMALKVMSEIGEEIASSFQIERLAMVHRLGRMLIGESSVAVIASAAHRQPAFEAALEGINRLKKRVPIWKKEHFADGEVWVEGEWDRHVPLAGRP
jgi:MoaE-MoaD fusion protein